MGVLAISRYFFVVIFSVWCFRGRFRAVFQRIHFYGSVVWQCWEVEERRSGDVLTIRYNIPPRKKERKEQLFWY